MKDAEMVPMHGGSEKTVSVENEALNQPTLNGESSMDAEVVIIPGGSVAPVPAVEDASVIGGKETEPLCDLNLSIAGSSTEESTSDEEIGKPPKGSGAALPIIESLFGSGSSDNTSGEGMVVILNEGSAVAVPVVEIDAPHLPTLNNGGSTMEDNVGDTEMVKIPGESAVAVPVVEVASVIGGDENEALHELIIILLLSRYLNFHFFDTDFLLCLSQTLPEGSAVAVTMSGGSAVPTVEDDSAIAVPSVIGGDVTIGVKNQLTLNCGESTAKEKRNEADMQIVLAESANEAGMQIVVAGSSVIGESTMEEKTNETGMQIVTVPVPIPIYDGTVPLQIEYFPSGSDPVAVTTATTPAKRKPGRPRKILESSQSASGISSKSSQSPSTIPQKRKVGRPLGSGKLQKLGAAGTCLESVTHHMLSVQTGEDVIERLNEFLRVDKGAVCILSAVGPVSSAYFRSNTSFDGIIRHEGKFDLLSICGSYAYNRETGCISGNLTAILSNSSTQVFGGVLGDVLVASGPVEVVLGTFKNSEKYIKNHLCRSPSHLNSPLVGGKTPIVEPSDELSSSDD